MKKKDIYQMGDFSVRYNSINNYYIVLYQFGLDHSIAKELNITYKKYVEILKQFNAKPNKESGEHYFKKQLDAINCVEYLNKKYGVMLKLMGE